MLMMGLFIGLFLTGCGSGFGSPVAALSTGDATAPEAPDLLRNLILSRRIVGWANRIVANIAAKFLARDAFPNLPLIEKIEMKKPA
jgi:hypothetical protein